MSGGGGGRKRRGHEEEHENHERWLVTYADMLTVLMALFIVMFALSVVDKAKFEKFKEGLNGDLGNGASLLEGGPGLQQAGDTPVDLQSAITALEEKQSRQEASAQERDDLERARQKILASLAAADMEDKVRFKLDERGLVVTVVTDDVLFSLGSATLRPKGNAVLDAIAPALTALPNQIRVEGHTDDLPISGRFASNWELSAERATSVLRYLLDTHSVPAKRLAAAGFADQRPLTPNTSPAARSANRRVEVIVLATPLGQPQAAAAPPKTAIPDPIPPITAVRTPVPALQGTATTKTEQATPAEAQAPETTTTDDSATDEEH